MNFQPVTTNQNFATQADRLAPPIQMGAPSFGYTRGQNGNFPLFFDPSTGLYSAWRWDYTENGESCMRAPFTRESLEGVKGVYLTSHPRFYASPWLNNHCRLTLVRMNEVPFMHHFTQNFQGLKKNIWSGKVGDPGNIEASRGLEYLTSIGIDAHFTNNNYETIDLLLMNPLKHIVDVHWQEFNIPNPNAEKEVKDFVAKIKEGVFGNLLTPQVLELVLEDLMGQEFTCFKRENYCSYTQHF